MAYASMDIIRSICGVSTTELSDDELSGLCSVAVGLFNKEVNIEVGGSGQEYELLAAAAEDDTDTIFYTKHFPIADSDGDATIGTTFDVRVYDDIKQNLPSAVTVSAIDAPTGKITLAAATTDSVYARYSYGPTEIDDSRFIMCYVYFVCALIWDRLHATALNVSQGGLSVSRVNYFWDRYRASKQDLVSATCGMAVEEAPKYLGIENDTFKEPEGDES